MSDFQSAVEYYLGKARSATNRGSVTDLEDQLEHVESVLEHYCEKSSPENISKQPRESSLVGEFTNFYRTIYDSSTTSPNPECAVLIHEFTWGGVYTGWSENHGDAFDNLLSVAIDQYLHQRESEEVNEAIIEKGESNLRALFQSTISGVDKANTLVELRDSEFQFNELFSQARRIVRETPKRGIVQASKTILDLLSGLLLRPAQFESDVLNYRMQIHSEASDTESMEPSGWNELQDNMALAARKHRLVSRYKREIETLQFVGSAWITHLHLEGVVNNERYEEFAESVIYNNYSNSSNVAEQFLQLMENEGYWETWEMHRRMDDSSGGMVSSGSASRGWLLNFYLLQMVRVIVEMGDIKSNLLDDNPIPQKDILRMRTSDVLERIDDLSQKGTFRDLLSPPYDDDKIETAIRQLYAAHERREEEAEESWKETIRNAEIPESRKISLRKSMSTEILSNFKLRKIFDSVGWIGTVDERPAEVEINSHVLGRPYYPKRVFVDDPYVAQNLNTSRISSKIASNATRRWIESFDSTDLSLPDGIDIAEFLVNQVGTSEVMCFIVDIGDDRRNIVDSDNFSYRSEEAEVELSNVATAGYLDGIPVITTNLDHAKAVVIDETKKAVYDRTGEGPLSIEVISGVEWENRHPDAVSEDDDPELFVVVEVKYSFGTSGSGITVIR